MSRKETNYPNVRLGGKLPKDKGETDPEQLRYGQNEAKKK